ncbi:hypothetical protein M3Y94_01095700 [Aphelenchoides besseyi]|nr:hypothetical protein M3Y94_01095700 [Aphelenchoides besseyi]KAI6221664.1 hypothetical protein M3Y95_00986200 [Aphelenchoides besseyi]
MFPVLGLDYFHLLTLVSSFLGSDRLDINREAYIVSAKIQFIEWEAFDIELARIGLINRVVYELFSNGSYTRSKSEVVLDIKAINSECSIYSQLVPNLRTADIEQPSGPLVLFIIEANANYCFYTFPFDGTSMLMKNLMNTFDKVYAGSTPCFFEFVYFYCPTMIDRVWSQTLVSNGHLQNNTRWIKFRMRIYIIFQQINVFGTQVWWKNSSIIGFDLYNLDTDLPFDANPYKVNSSIPFQRVNGTHLKTETFNLQEMIQMVEPDWQFDGIDQSKRYRQEAIFQFHAQLRDNKSPSPPKLFIDRLNYANNEFCSVLTRQARQSVMLMMCLVSLLFVVNVGLIVCLFYGLLYKRKKEQKLKNTATTNAFKSTEIRDTPKHLTPSPHPSPNVVQTAIQSPLLQPTASSQPSKTPIKLAGQ